MNSLQLQILPTDNDLEIPTLDIDKQAVTCDIPFICFGEQSRTYNMNGYGTLHFYTDDYRFSSIWSDPSKILKHNPRNIVEPNFSIYNETPNAMALNEIYKKRYLARLMQNNGINVFVDLNVCEKFYRLNMLGVPRGWSSFCTRGCADRIETLKFEYEFAKEWAEGNDLTFVIYSGGAEAKEFAKQNGCIWVRPTVGLNQKKLQARKIITESMQIFGENLNTLIADQIKKIEETQVSNFKKAIYEN